MVQTLAHPTVFVHTEQFDRLFSHFEFIPHANVTCLVNRGGQRATSNPSSITCNAQLDSLCPSLLCFSPFPHSISIVLHTPSLLLPPSPASLGSLASVPAGWHTLLKSSSTSNFPLPLFHRNLPPSEIFRSLLGYTRWNLPAQLRRQVYHTVGVRGWINSQH